LPSDAIDETKIIERIARLEEAVAYNKDLIVGISEKLDKFIEEIHSNQISSVSQYGDLNVRVSKLEQRLETEREDDYMWYTKLGVFIAFISAIMNYIFKLVGR